MKGKFNELGDKLGAVFMINTLVVVSAKEKERRSLGEIQMHGGFRKEGRLLRFPLDADAPGPGER